MPTDREYFEELREKTFAAAIANGYEIVVPTANQLQLDIDRPWILDTPESEDFRAVINIIAPSASAGKDHKVVCRMMEVFEVTRWYAWKSAGGNCHVMITLRGDMPIVERIALQAILGSDPMREMLNLHRVQCGAEDPIALFRPPKKEK